MIHRVTFLDNRGKVYAQWCVADTQVEAIHIIHQQHPWGIGWRVTHTEIA